MLLETINSPADLKKLKPEQLPALAEEIRGFCWKRFPGPAGIWPPTSVRGTDLALHYCFDSPNDKIIWDVGHQAYTHKILTGTP